MVSVMAMLRQASMGAKMWTRRDGTRLEALSKARNGSRCSLNECLCTNAATARPRVSLSTGMEVQESFSAYCGDRAAINSPSGWNRFDEGDSSPRISAPSPHQGESSQPKNFILAARSSLVTSSPPLSPLEGCELTHTDVPRSIH